MGIIHVASLNEIVPRADHDNVLMTMRPWAGQVSPVSVSPLTNWN